MLAAGDRVRAVVDEQHGAGLTRDQVTAAVHNLRWELSPGRVDAFAAGSVRLEIDHPAYLESAVVSDTTHRELRTDLLGDLRADATPDRPG